MLLNPLPDQISVAPTDEQCAGKHELPEIPLRSCLYKKGSLQVFSGPEVEWKKFPIFRSKILGGQCREPGLNIITRYSTFNLFIFYIHKVQRVRIWLPIKCEVEVWPKLPPPHVGIVRMLISLLRKSNSCVNTRE